MRDRIMRYFPGGSEPRAQVLFAEGAFASDLTNFGVAVGINPIVTLEKAATEYDRRSGIKRLRCTAK